MKTIGIWIMGVGLLLMSLGFLIDLIKSAIGATTDAQEIARAIRSLGAAYIIVKLGPWGSDDGDDKKGR